MNLFYEYDSSRIFLFSLSGCADLGAGADASTKKTRRGNTFKPNLKYTFKKRIWPFDCAYINKEYLVMILSLNNLCQTTNPTTVTK